MTFITSVIHLLMNCYPSSWYIYTVRYIFQLCSACAHAMSIRCSSGWRVEISYIDDGDASGHVTLFVSLEWLPLSAEVSVVRRFDRLGARPRAVLWMNAAVVEVIWLRLQHYRSRKDRLVPMRFFMLPHVIWPEKAFNLRNRRWGGCVYVLQMFFFVCFLFFCFFHSPQKYQTTVLGNGWTDFHETFTKR